MRTIRFTGAKALALLVIITILGGVGGYIFYDVTEYRLPGGHWQPVSLGGEKATRILGQDRPSGDVYIQTSQGNVYSCTPTNCVPAPAPVPQVSNPHFNGDYNPPPPPADVIDSLTVPPPIYGLCGGQINFVILADGSVWSWSKIGCCEMGCFIIIIYPLGGMVLGLVAGIIILIIWRRRSPAAPSDTATRPPSTRLTRLGTFCLFAGVILLSVLIFNTQINIIFLGTYLSNRVFAISAGLIVVGVVLTVAGRRSKAK